MTDHFDPLQMVSMFFMLGLLPLVVTMMTSFTKFSIVLTLLRSALGVQQAPSNLVISGIALAATLVVMSPTIAKIEAALPTGDSGEVVMPSNCFRRYAARSANSC
jgi:type III secretion protein R